MRHARGTAGAWGEILYRSFFAQVHAWRGAECGWGGYWRSSGNIFFKLSAVVNYSSDNVLHCFLGEVSAYLQVIVPESVGYIFRFGEVDVDSRHRTCDAKSASDCGILSIRSILRALFAVV